MNQTRVQVLSDWKGLADAEAARNAVFAALLARGGLTGPAPIFEGRAGFFKQVSGPATVDVDAFGRRGVPFRIGTCGMKAYPAVVYTQTAIAAGIAVAKEVTSRVGAIDRVTAVEIATTRRGLQQTASEAIPRNGRRRRGTRRITACPTSPRGRCSTATSPMTATPRKSCATRGILAFMRKISRRRKTRHSPRG
jgi:2-methylcitrate dehydratase PrpD